MSTLPTPTAQTRAASGRRAGTSLAARFGRFSARSWSFWLCVAILLLVAMWALFPHWFASAEPLRGNIAQRLQPPSAAALFGTDSLGRDLYARVVHGASASLATATLALIIAFGGSAVIGTVAGYLGGLFDEIVMRLVDVMLAIPALLIALMLVTTLGFGSLNVAIAVGVSSVASFTRLIRAEVLRVRGCAFVEASRAYGLPVALILTRHVFPHARSPLLALLTLEFGNALLSVSALSFLGYGVQPPAPEWGSLIANGRSYLANAWWLTTLPGAMILIIVLAANRLGAEAGRIAGKRSTPW